MIRRAVVKDIPAIGELLSQVCLVHHNIRPDIFKMGRKYTDEQLKEMLSDESCPILVYADEGDNVMGYCFCILKQNKDDTALTDIKTLYIDDLCVDEKHRGKHIGKELYKAAVALAKEKGCYNLTLNVWSGNDDAIGFYEALGLAPQKIGMELII